MAYLEFHAAGDGNWMQTLGKIHGGSRLDVNKFTLEGAEPSSVGCVGFLGLWHSLGGLSSSPSAPWASRPWAAPGEQQDLVLLGWN